MSVIGRIEPALGDGERVAVRLLRRWVAAQADSVNPLPDLVGFAAELGVSATAAVAFGSLFQLTEACLGRPLVAECCCSPAVGPDERAVLTLLAAAAQDIAPPHGLSGALLWAARSVARLVGPGRARARSDACPFAMAS